VSLFRVLERASDVLLAAACRLSQDACQSGSDRMGSRRENGTNNDQRRLQSNASSVRNSVGVKKRRTKGLKMRMSKGRCSQRSEREYERRGEETSQRGRRANGSGGARLR
jgi:hypothetical protein